MYRTPDTLVEGWGPLDGLPGNPMIWILILGELLVFGILLIGFGVARSLDPSLFAASQAGVNRLLGATNTQVEQLRGNRRAPAIDVAGFLALSVGLRRIPSATLGQRPWLFCS